MGVERDSPPSAVPPSSPPFIEHAVVVASPTTNPVPSSSPSITPARLPSSPEIARLPPPPPPPRTPASSRGRHWENSSEYYTAAWGSPYDSPTWSRSARTAVSEQIHSDDPLDRESSPSVYFGLEHLVPSLLGDLNLARSFQYQDTLAPAVEEEDLVTPRSRTKHWVQLPQSRPSDRKHWWSDESGHSGSDPEPKKRRRAASPPAKVEKEEEGFVKGHKKHQENRTLNQQTFLDTLRDNTDDMSGIYASRWAAVPSNETTAEAGGPDGTAEEGKKKEEEKSELMEPEKIDGDAIVKGAAADEDVVAKEKVDADATANVKVADVEVHATEDDAQDVESAGSPTAAGSAEKEVPETVAQSQEIEADAEMPAPSIEAEILSQEDFSEPAPAPLLAPDPTRLEPPRLRKRVSWRGKTCIVSIPNVDFQALGLPQPMSAADVQLRLKQFEDEGYNINGFDVWPEVAADASEAHVKPIYPDEVEHYDVAGKVGPKVSLPDLNIWKEYMDWLTEQKLAALGVSIATDEPIQTSSQEMSRQSSNQYPPLPFSPPIPGSSAGSMGRPMIPRGHSHTMSVASPILSPGNGGFGHMHRHSTFTGGFGFPQMSQQSSASSLQAFSPQPQFTFPGLARGGSPAQLAALRHEASPLHTTGSPLHQQMLSQSSQDYSRGMVEDQGRRQHAYTQSLQNPLSINAFLSQSNSLHQTPALPELPEEEDEEELEEPEEPTTPPCVPPHKRAEFNADIAIPTPRGHRHNISEGLERDVRKAEDRQKSASNNYIEVDEEGSDEITQLPTHGYKASHGHAESLSKPAEKDPFGAEHSVQDGTHTRKKSASRLNVAAPVFTFNPEASFQPRSTAFTFDMKAAHGMDASAEKGHSRQTSSGNFNAAAPIFRPSVPFSMPKSDFNFSAESATSFPAFDMPTAPSLDYTPNDTSTSADEQPRIFGAVNIPDIVKPSKKSKAISIVRPQDVTTSATGSGTEFEDSEGRIAQSDDRLKRQRKADDDGDEVPQFAVPTPMQDSVILAPTIVPSQPLNGERSKYSPERIESDPKLASTNNDIVVANGVADAGVEPSKTIAGPSFSHGHTASGSLSALAPPFRPFNFHPAEEEKEDDEQDPFESISDLEDGEIRDITEPQRAVPMQNGTISNISKPSGVEPSFDEIDAVMRQLNEAEATLPAEDTALSPLPSDDDKPLEGVTYLPEWSRSDAPSPSPERRRLAPFANHQDSSFTVHDHGDSGEVSMNGWPQIRRLNKADEVPTSDWSGVLSAPDEEKLHERSRFFDNHIDELLGRVVDRRLQPLEDSIRNIQSSVNRNARSVDYAKRSSSAIDSDADDEDDLPDDQRHRPISRGRDKRVDQIKVAVMEALREQSPRRSQSAYDIADLHSALADMKVSFARAASASLELDDIRAVVEEVLTKQNQALVHVPQSVVAEDLATHKHELSELESRLNQTLAGALEEANHRRAVEEREAEGRRLLRLAEEELALLRSSNRDDESRVNAMEDERAELLDRVERAEEARDRVIAKNESLVDNMEKVRAELLDRVERAEEARDEAEARSENQDNALDNERVELLARVEKAVVARDQLEAKNETLESEHEAMQATLEEYRKSSTKWRQGLEDSKHERADLENTVSELEQQLEEGQESSNAMRRRLEKLHNDMATAAGQLASEKTSWKSQEEMYRANLESIQSQRAAFAKRNEELEAEVRSLRTNALELAEAKHTFDSMRSANFSLEAMVQKLQAEVLEQQAHASRFERDFHDARESGRAEIHRTRMSLEADVEAANHQVNIVRADLELAISRSRSELEHVKLEAETVKARHERMLEDEDVARREALRKVNQANSLAFDESRHKHEAIVQDLTAQHARAMQHALEDKQRSQAFLTERLSLSEAKMQHYQERTIHLQERLDVAKSAAQAAAQSAQAKSNTAGASSFSTGLPERVSPQALRESILVLQEQLQERESRIDRLQAQVQKEGPAKLKERDTEISWLRELLAVRSEELGDLVNTLSNPSFDRDMVRDTAIRIQANLEMERQEKERSSNSSQTLSGQALASISSFAAPKAKQFFNTWRSSMENSALRNTTRPAGPTRSYTPSKGRPSSNHPPGYFAGIMTPPASNLRGTPSPETTTALPPPRLQTRSTSKAPLTSVAPAPMATQHQRQPSMSSEVPTTPLFEEQNYDKDAEDSQVMQKFSGAEEDEEVEEDDAKDGPAQAEEDEDLDIADSQAPAFRSLDSELDEPSPPPMEGQAPILT
nr:hypothetical protein CFP56_00984 [Quercus suber]